LVIVLAVSLSLIFTDTRPASPIELDMIAEFDKNVSDFVKDDVTKVWTEMKPFPVRNLISTNKITIDETFEVNNLTMTLSNINIPIGSKLM
jgi:hypothetical protein